MKIPVLDKGYVELIETWGSEERIIEAARMSTSKGFQGWGTPETPGDEKLLRYLYTHKHMTPFEMAGMIIEVQLPIFVCREWHRHRTMSYNELSSRYTELPNLFYIPNLERIKAGGQGKGNKQGSGAEIGEEQATYIRAELERECDNARNSYEHLLHCGLSRELSRVVIPVTQYTRMRASANLRNWLQFLELRLGEGAQWEIMEYAKVAEGLIKDEFPRTWELFNEARGN